MNALPFTGKGNKLGMGLENGGNRKGQPLSAPFVCYFRWRSLLLNAFALFWLAPWGVQILCLTVCFNLFVRAYPDIVSLSLL